MGGYLGVQQGSKYPPQFIHLTYKAANSDPNKLVKVALVGKGLTFDRYSCYCIVFYRYRVLLYVVLVLYCIIVEDTI